MPISSSHRAGRTRLLALAGAAMLLPVPAKTAPAPGQIARIAGDLVLNHVIPGYEAFEKASGRLETRVRAFCTEGGPARLSSVQKDFRTALAVWMGVQQLRFGPVMRKDRHYRIQFWPDKHGQAARQIRRLLARPQADIPSAAQLAGKSAGIQGFPALERLLFGEGAGLLGDGSPKGGRRCALAGAIAGNIAAMAAAVHRDWREQYAAPARDWARGQGESKQAAEMVGKLFRAFMDQAEIITELKLRRPLGATLEKARPRRAESWRSETSLSNVAQNLTALGAMFSGAEGRWSGLGAALDDDGEEGDARKSIAEGLSYAVTFIERQEMTMISAAGDPKGRRAIEFLILHIGQVRDTAGEYLVPALGVSVGFNALDGD